MLTEREIDAVIAEWWTGTDAKGAPSPHAQWSQVFGIPVRIPPHVETLAAMLVGPAHAVRCSVLADAGDGEASVRVEIEDRDEMAPSKYSGSPLVVLWRPTPKAGDTRTIDHVVYRHQKVKTIRHEAAAHAAALVKFDADQAARSPEAKAADVAIEAARVAEKARIKADAAAADEAAVAELASVEGLEP